MTRQYQLGKRAVTTAENRAKVLAAARQLFGTLGFRQVSMDAVAERAGVGRTTIFEQFQSKGALFQAVADDLRQQVFQLQFPDPATHSLDARLMAAFHGARDLWTTELSLFRRLDGMALLEPTGSEASIRDAEERRTRLKALAHELVNHHRVRHGTSEADVADLLGLLTSFAAYSQLRRVRGEATSVGHLIDLLGTSVLLAPHH